MFVAVLHGLRTFTCRVVSLRAPLYAGDTQIYDVCLPDNVNAFSLNVNECFNGVAAWMHFNMQLKSDKTEFLWRTKSPPTSSTRSWSKNCFFFHRTFFIADRPATWAYLSTRTCRWRLMSNCQANCLIVLQHATTAVQYPASGTDRCFPVTGGRASPQSTRLL